MDEDGFSKINPKAYTRIAILCGIFLLSFFTYAIIHSYKKSKALEGNVKYTIGTTTERNIKYITYEFEVKGLKYKDECALWKYKVPGRYVVMFSVENPHYSKMVDLIIPDSIVSAPPEGWDFPPGMLYSVGKINYVSGDMAQVVFNYGMQDHYVKTKCEFLRKEDMGKWYFISFYPSDLEYCLTIYNLQPDREHLYAPASGWTQKPF